MIEPLLFSKLLEFKGKNLLLESTLRPTTFLRLLKDELNLPYIANKACRVKDGAKYKLLCLSQNTARSQNFSSVFQESLRSWS